ncbi:MAG TPA: S-layer homology domain-containing protein, partial [Candidatus Angelobacter sp.]|nr:S-layer homology domain-containing protein [Candidatus Angelobacter sp.]
PTPTRTPTPSAPTFSDIANSKFRADIEWLAAIGITSGCGDGKFCPDGLVTRAQMASFLSRAVGLPPADRDYFTDDAGNRHESNINRLAQAGITSGCGPSRFCPSGLVTREQMASFLVRAFELPATSRDFFTDDADSRHQSNINRLAASGITSGCSADRYCPSGLVTRGQMAAFLHRAFSR